MPALNEKPPLQGVSLSGGSMSQACDFCGNLSATVKILTGQDDIIKMGIERDRDFFVEE